jgi:hypothetical protein
VNWVVKLVAYSVGQKVVKKVVYWVASMVVYLADQWAV